MTVRIVTLGSPRQRGDDRVMAVRSQGAGVMLPVWLRMLILTSALVFSSFAGAVTADAAAQAEIAHLLAYLGTSGCEFQRNGTWYSSKEAQAHLEKKTQYLAKHSQIGSAEDFIDKAASASSMSGQPYLVRCAPDQAVPSGVWLRAELVRFRGPGGQPGK